MSEPTGETYTIRRLSEFAKVPADRREVCLMEFRRALELQEEKNEELKQMLSRSAFGRWLWKIGVRFNMTRFDWIDDGLRNEKIEIDQHWKV